MEESCYQVFNINFRIEDTQVVDEQELMMFNYEFVGNKTLCSEKIIDGSRMLSYNIPATLPLAEFMKKQMYAGEFLTILANILKQLIYFDGNDMPLKKVVLNTDYMYIDLEDLNVQILYMPIDREFRDCNVCEFVQAFIGNLRFADMTSVGFVNQILEYLDSRMMFSLKDFCNFILALMHEDMLDDEMGDSDTTVLSQMSYKNIVPYLIRVRTNTIVGIEKNEFTIGKSNECDYSIPDNKKISRRHCSLRISNGECYIKDEGSTNHTYINGNLLQPGFEVMLKNDDIIKMADEEFKYWVK